MKIKLNNATLVDIMGTLSKFDNASGKLSYAIHKTKRKLADDVKDFEDIRNKLIVKYGDENEDGTYTIHKDTEAYNKYINEIIPISEELVEVELYQITREEFDNSDYYNEKASTKDYDILEVLFVKKDESEENIENNTENE